MIIYRLVWICIIDISVWYLAAPDKRLPTCYFMYVQELWWIPRLMLIVVMWLTIHVVWVQGCICVLCVRNNVPQKNIWTLTRENTLEKSCIHALNVRSNFHHHVTWATTRVFVEAKTSVQNTGNVLEGVVTSQYTCKVIQERNRLNVLFATKNLKLWVNLWHTEEFTMETNHKNVACVTRHLVCLEI